MLGEPEGLEEAMGVGALGRRDLFIAKSKVD